MSVPEFYLGQRVSFTSSLCTIRYVGPVDGTKGTWLGVEWDNPEAGKHNGEHGGRRYFHCLHASSTAASFVRPTRPADPLVGFLQAVYQKYAADEDDPRSAGGAPIEISGKVVEEVGFEKIRQQQAALQELRIVLVDGFCVAGLGPCPWRGEPLGLDWERETNRVAEVCPKIVELDLSRNLIERWMDVYGICKELPFLRRLVLDYNRFRDLSTQPLEPEQLRDAFSSVQELSLNSTFLSWEEITTLLKPFSSLRTLSLASNNLSAIPNPPPITTLTTLSLAHNPISTLASIQPLTSLPSLHTLSLQSCLLGTVTLTPLPSPFPALTTLNLSHNALPNLTTLSALPPSFPHLTALRTTANPFLATTTLSPDAIHLLTIARLPGLTALNFAAVRPAERDNAERYYLAQIAAELAAAPAEREREILAAHPRWDALCKAHETPVVRRPREGGDDAEAWPSGGLGARLVTLRLRRAAEESKAKGQDAQDEVKELVVPRSVSMDRLRALVGRAVGAWPGRVRLVWETGEWDFAAAGPGGDDLDAWSVGSSGASEGEDAEGGGVGRQGGHRVPREVELARGTRPLGFWIEGREADVRVEITGKAEGE